MPTEDKTSRNVTKVLRRVKQKPFDAGINGNSGSCAFSTFEIAAHKNSYTGMISFLKVNE
jgi:hypothetical protein